MRVLTKILALVFGSLALPSGALADCASELRIVSVTPLSFGTVATATEGGVVVVGANGAMATLGGVGAGPGAQPGSIQLCGPAGARFLLLFEPAELNIAAEHGTHRPHMVRNLEVLARGAEIHPAAAGQWNGRLGPSGRADIRVGGTLTVPPRQIHDSFVAPFRIAVIPSE
jgi:hypothetical protein